MLETFRSLSWNVHLVTGTSPRAQPGAVGQKLSIPATAFCLKVPTLQQPARCTGRVVRLLTILNDSNNILFEFCNSLTCEYASSVWILGFSWIVPRWQPQCNSYSRISDVAENVAKVVPHVVVIRLWSWSGRGSWHQIHRSTTWNHCSSWRQGATATCGTFWHETWKTRTFSMQTGQKGESLVGPQSAPRRLAKRFQPF